MAAKEDVSFEEVSLQTSESLASAMNDCSLPTGAPMCHFKVVS